MKKVSKYLVTALGAFGVLALVGLYDQSDSKASANDDLAIGSENQHEHNQCTSPLSVDYLDSLEQGGDGEPKFPGCGGLL